MNSMRKAFLLAEKFLFLTRIADKNAFTLAEVLITLGIIGVVAAMTMPALMNKTRNKELHTAFLKTYSELNQVAGLFKADNGISVADAAADAGLYSESNGLSHGISPSFADKIFSYYKGAKSLTQGGHGTSDGEGGFIAFYPINNLNGMKYSGGVNSGGSDSSFLCDNSAFKNNLTGAIFILNDAPRAGKNGPVICVDINGQKKPNRYGIDYFMFIFTTDGRVIPIGQQHRDNPGGCSSSNGSCNNFNNIGAEYCLNTSSDISKNTSCAYYALTNTHPTEAGKDYWTDFLGEVYSR